MAPVIRFFFNFETNWTLLHPDVFIGCLKQWCGAGLNWKVGSGSGSARKWKAESGSGSICRWQAKIYGIWAYLSTFSRSWAFYLEARIRIRIHIKGTSNIRIRIKVTINVMRIRNTGLKMIPVRYFFAKHPRFFSYLVLYLQLGTRIWKRMLSCLGSECRSITHYPKTSGRSYLHSNWNCVKKNCS